MTLSEALSSINQPIGFTSAIAALMGGDGRSVLSVETLSPSLEQITAQLQEAEEAQRNCSSDAAYWGYQGQVSYLRAVSNILKAAQITGPDNLPDIEPPQGGGVVMDECAKIERFARAILDKVESEQ